MTITINLNADHIHNLDLSPLQAVITQILADGIGAIALAEQKIVFQIDYPQEEFDPRELSEISEIRLWFIQADAYYPWLPFFLNWREKELARYAAMLVPHQFHKTDGIQYNPEALEIFLMSKIFVLKEWLNRQGLECQELLAFMATMLGYELDAGFFQLIGVQDISKN